MLSKLILIALVFVPTFGQVRNRTIFTSEPAVPLSGSAPAGTVRVTWESSRGFGDVAETHSSSSGTVTWTIASVPLRPGLNQIRIQALQKSGDLESSYVNIRYSAENTVHPRSATIAPTPLATTGLWPVVAGVARVPYTISARDQGVPSALANINSAISEFNSQLSGVIQFVAATPSDVNVAAFDLDPGNFSGTCEALVGMQGNTQTLTGAINCTVGTLLHEMGHTIGLWHEQSRADRNNFVNFLYSNVDKPQASNFDQLSFNEADTGLYNYASIMQYPAFEFSRDGISPTLETMPPGIALGSTLAQYSTGDLDGIKRLYGHAPTSVTIDTNPTGLAVLIDGTQYTAPHTFSWATGSQHTLSVPVDSHGQTLQTVSGQNYLFGRWNLPPAINPPILQTITVAAGSGSQLNPTTSPAVTAYLASFIPIHIYGPNAFPSGSFTPTPPPSNIIIGGVSTQYYQDRQKITLQANGPAGYTFYDWFTPNATLPNYYANPITFYDATDLNNLQAVFVQDPVTTITGAAPDLPAGSGSEPGFTVQVDPGTSNAQVAFTPRNFVDTYDGSSWAAGQAHQLCGTFLVGNACPSSSLPSQSPVTTNITYAFNNWTGFSTTSSNLLPITVAPAGQRTFTANYTPSFRTIVLPSPACGGNSVSPNQNGNIFTDMFFPYGAQQSFTATAGAGGSGDPGFAFVGWTQDLSGVTNPDSVTIQGQLLGTANFNTAGAMAPLAIQSFLPASIAVTPASMDLTINGTGFTTNPSITFTYFNGAFRSNTLISSTQLTIHLQAGDLGTAGYFPIEVFNVGNTTCGVYSLADYAVTTLPGGPNLTVSKTHTGNFTQGQQGAQYTILVTNSGAGATNGSPVTVSEIVPSGLTLVSMSGAGWTCPTGGFTCTRSDGLNPGLSYPAITATVNVASGALSPQINLVDVTGGGSVQGTNGDLTTIVANSGPASITATGGTPQTATVQTAFARALQATVKNGSGQPVSGVVVTFSPPASGASGTFAGGVNTATTNASGIATSARFTANSIAGSYTVSASVAGVATPASFALTNKAGKAASITATGGTPQTATIKTAFASSLQATLQDSFGNPVSGATVTFTAPATGASGTFAGGVKTAVTNAAGVAISKIFTANGAAGTYTVSAAVAGLATTASFSLTNAVGKPATITATGGTPQSTKVKTAFALPLQVTVKDAGGNLVSGVLVSFKAPTSGASGSFAGGVKTATTNASGVATAATFTANAVTGSYAVTASFQGARTPASFSLTNTQ